MNLKYLLFVVVPLCALACFLTFSRLNRPENPPRSHTSVDQLGVEDAPQWESHASHQRSSQPGHDLTSSQLEVMFSMIGRNVGRELPFVLRNVERLAKIFAVAHVVLVEVRVKQCVGFLAWYQS